MLYFEGEQRRRQKEKERETREKEPRRNRKHQKKRKEKKKETERKLDESNEGCCILRLHKEEPRTRRGKEPENKRERTRKRKEKGFFFLFFLKPFSFFFFSILIVNVLLAVKFISRHVYVDYTTRGLIPTKQKVAQKKKQSKKEEVFEKINKIQPFRDCTEKCNKNKANLKKNTEK